MNRQKPFALVIFDCDGVLVDSETVVSNVVARYLTQRGWRLTGPESHALFLGMSLSDMRPVIEQRLGTLPADWVAELSAQILATLADGVPLMPGVEAMLAAVTALGLPWRIASNSSRAELRIKFAKTGLDRIIAPDRMHSAGDVVAKGGRGKPAPDLFLATAAAEGVVPADCLVVEDSVPGVRGAIAAGMTCLGYVPHGDGRALLAEGATLLRDLAALPPLLRASQPAIA